MKKMHKEKANLPEIQLIGLSLRTNNASELNPASAKIGSLVGHYYMQSMAQKIPNRKKPGVTYSVYTDYESDMHGDYTYFIGEEVTSIMNSPENMDIMIIPAAKYQKFTTPSGHMPNVVLDAWQKIWGMSDAELGGKRSYNADFELYDERALDPENTAVDIYIGIESK